MAFTLRLMPKAFLSLPSFIIYQPQPIKSTIVRAPPRKKESSGKGGKIHRKEVNSINTSQTSVKDQIAQMKREAKELDALQRHYTVLQALALEEDEMPKIIDETIPDVEGMAGPGVAKAMEEFKLSVYGEDYDEGSEEKVTDISLKRKTAALNAAKESVNYDWTDLAKRIIIK